MSILVVNQSIIDIFACLFSLITTAVKMDIHGLSRDSIRDQFLCRFWVPKVPVWATMVTSTYGILLTTLSRYFAVIYPIKYKHVRIVHLRITVFRKTDSNVILRKYRPSVTNRVVNGTVYQMLS